MKKIKQKILALIFATAMTTAVAIEEITSISEINSAYTSLTCNENGNIFIDFNNPLGDLDGSNTLGYYWDPSTYKLTSTSEDDADIVVNFSNTQRWDSTTAVSGAGIDYSFVNLSNTTAETGTSYVAGSAIFVKDFSIGDITGDFIGNSSTSDSVSVYGGAIFSSSSSIGDISSNFIGNSVSTSAAKQASGGAIQLSGGSAGDITGDFIGNSANSAGGAAYGGAIYSMTAIATITGDFIGNSTNTTTAQSMGGAIHTFSNITSIIGDFIGNSANSTYGSYGGAIINTGATISSIEGNFVNNSAVGTLDACGGAVYNNGGKITFTASEGNDYLYIGNYVTTSSNGIPTSDDDENGGFLYNGGATTIFNTDTNSSITIGNGKTGYDSIAGTGTITKTGAGTLTVNSSMEFFTGTLNVEAGTMDISNTLGASEISIGTTDSAATLSLTVNTSGGNTLTSDTLSTISFNNTNSVLKLITTTTTAGDYALSVNENFSITDLDNVITYGGTFDGVDFTVAAAQVVLDSTSITTNNNVTLTGSSNVVIGKASDVIISTSSVYDTDTTAITISSASEITDSVSSTGTYESIYTAISEDVSSNFTVLSSWDFDIDFTAEEGLDSVVVSFLVTEGLDLSTIYLYHTDDYGKTTDVTSSIVSYEDGYLSFDANSFSSYTAIVAVPEPSTYAMILGALALGLAMYRRRK